MRAAKLSEVTGGSNGINGFANSFQEWNPFNNNATYGFRLFDRINLEFSGADVWELLVGWGLVLLSVLLVWKLVNCPWGRVLKSIREDEDAAHGARQERLPVQDAVAHPRRFVRHARRDLLRRAAERRCSPTTTPRNRRSSRSRRRSSAGWRGCGARSLGAMLFWVILSFTENVLIELIDNGIMPESIMRTIAGRSGPLHARRSDADAA